MYRNFSDEIQRNDGCLGTMNLHQRIQRDKAAVVIIDIQEKLLPSIDQQSALLANAVRLVKGAQVLKVPMLVTEQYPKGIGRTVAALRDVMRDVRPIEKLAFSACGVAPFMSQLEEKRIGDVILCGIEAHICVCQSALDLLQRGYRVFMVADAASSRTAENKSIGLRRMEQAGAVLVSTEMILFELLGHAGTEEFREILSLVK
jgi:nicotinamidase-related amidase